MVQAYIVAAKHPFASVVAQEIFQSGIIPADTDFRIYRDFGNIPGMLSEDTSMCIMQQCAFREQIFLLFSKARAFSFGLLCSLLKMFFGDCCFPEKLPKNQENTPGINNTLLNILF